MNTQKLYNPVMVWLLHSPLRRFGDKHTLLLTVTGRKTGKSYTFPVSYIRDGETLLIMTHKTRTWWKNLLTEAPVTVFVDGQEFLATGKTTRETDLVAKALLLFLQKVPAWRWELHVKLDATGQPEHPEDLKRLAADDLVLCTIQLAKVALRQPDDVLQSAAGTAR
jgi:deazaflavin-dependent oxidoreductase (nitroreductase family)